MPLHRWHFGGDEVPQDAYSGSAACQDFLQQHPRLSATKDLKTYFVKRIVAMAGRLGLAIYGWEDAYSNEYGMLIERSELKTSHDVVSQVYYNTWEGGGAMKAYHLANNDYKVCYVCLGVFNTQGAALKTFQREYHSFSHVCDCFSSRSCWLIIAHDCPQVQRFMLSYAEVTELKTSRTNFANANE